MCGIVAVLARDGGRAVPPGETILAWLDCAVAAARDVGGLGEAAARVEDADRALRGAAGVAALLGRPELLGTIERRCDDLGTSVGAIESALDAGALAVDPDQVESVNAPLLRLKDAVWALRCDRLRTARAVALLAGGTERAGEVVPPPGLSQATVAAYTQIQIALSAIDRLEVRGRDSAGLHILVDGSGLDRAHPDMGGLLAERLRDRLLTSGAVRLAGPDRLAFVYKKAAEIGELGDNVRSLREAIAADGLLRAVLAAPSAQIAVLAHTRWASVGSISEPNAHPLNHEEDSGAPEDAPFPYVAAALNGDVDNHDQLRASEGLSLPSEITTDAKVIPVLVSRAQAAGASAVDAFTATVARLDGSVAIGATSGAAPDQLLLAVRGSGQALYVGLAEDLFVVASEPYGVVEETGTYLRMDGESTGGQVVVLSRAAAGTVDGIERRAYDGRLLPVTAEELTHAGVTTRDIDRGGYSHYFLKEVSQAPESFRKTLRGKIVEVDGRLRVALPAEAMPDHVSERLAAGKLSRIIAIGQGTAAVAAAAFSEALNHAVTPGAPLRAEALRASELSGFRLEDDMSDALVVAISQSGTTTDTNRTVDLVRARGATVVAIVNRRNSDLTDRADGVLYTSDGRDVEMSVASTKAFYAQVAAGILLAQAIAVEAGCANDRDGSRLLAALRELPAAMRAVLDVRPQIAAAAQAYAPQRRHWAVVGSGTNRLAAAELRIKLSELAYKAVACDDTEDKKHIDLSSEPLILVCAAGLPPGALSDLAKELAIFRAHKAAPVVIATRGTEWPAALATLPVPEVDGRLGFVLSAMAGHLFGYEAALAIDGLARALREARAAVEEVATRPSDPYAVMARLGGSLSATSSRFHEALRSGIYNGSLEAGTAVRLASLLRYATGIVPLDVYELEHGRVGTPGAVIEDLLDALNNAIDELTRPIDAIKHQAKTVTVGISRPEEDLFVSPLVVEVVKAGVPRDRFTYRVLRTLATLTPAVEEVTGWTRYAVEGSVDGESTIRVIDKGGIAKGIASRAETEARPLLRGTKHRAATLREVTVAKGATDGRTVVLVPEIARGNVLGITLLHSRFADRLPPEAMRAVLEGYQARYSALVDAVTEIHPVFDDSRLEQVPVIELLTSPVHVLAGHWRT